VLTLRVILVVFFDFLNRLRRCRRGDVVKQLSCDPNEACARHATVQGVLDDFFEVPCPDARQKIVPGNLEIWVSGIRIALGAP
jgi:hypothetical protein